MSASPGQSLPHSASWSLNLSEGLLIYPKRRLAAQAWSQTAWWKRFGLFSSQERRQADESIRRACPLRELSRTAPDMASLPEEEIS